MITITPLSHAYIHAYIHTFIRTCLHTYIYIHKCIHNTYIHIYIHTYIRQNVIVFMGLIFVFNKLVGGVLSHKCRRNNLPAEDCLHSWLSYFQCKTDTTGHHVTKGQGQRASRFPSVSSPGAHAFCYLAGQLRKQLMWAIVGMYLKEIPPFTVPWRGFSHIGRDEATKSDCLPSAVSVQASSDVHRLQCLVVSEVCCSAVGECQCRAQVCQRFVSSHLYK